MRKKFAIGKDSLPELVRYGAVGILTTVVNYSAYLLGVMLLDWHYLVATCFAWCLATGFSFGMNKCFVFRSPARGRKAVLREGSSFFAARWLSGILEMGLMYLLVDGGGLDNKLAKILVGGIIVIMNYVVSKRMVFVSGESGKDKVRGEYLHVS